MSNEGNADEFKRTKRETSIRIQGKSSKNGFENHTNTEKQDNLLLRTSWRDELL